MAWGVVSLLGGAALLAAMLTFDVREIGWSYLNDSGQVIPGTSNVLGVAGLYGAGILYWALGGMAWMLVILLEWWGLYRLLHRGSLPRSVVYGGLFLLLFGCLFLTAGHVPGDAWVARHQIQGAGGLAGHLLGTGLLLPLTGTSAVLVLSGLGYLLALVYAAGMHPRPLFRAMLREWRALAHEQEGEKNGAPVRAACQGGGAREGQHGRCGPVRPQAGRKGQGILSPPAAHRGRPGRLI